MGSIGLIFKADRAVEALPTDWVPQPLGSRMDVVAAVEKHFPSNDSSLALDLQIEEESESPNPRTISASGVWGPRELFKIQSLCRILDARFYDSEAGEFINLEF
jgi:hypothetical protein